MAKTLDDVTGIPAVATRLGAVLPEAPTELHISIRDGDEMRHIVIHPNGSVTGADEVRIYLRESMTLGSYLGGTLGQEESDGQG